LVGDGIDVFSIVNESTGGNGRPKHCLVKRPCDVSNKEQQISNLNKTKRGSKSGTKSGLFTDVTNDDDRGMEDYNNEVVYESYNSIQRYKADSTIVGAEIHSSEQYVVVLGAKGNVFIYHLWLGELRGVFPTVVNIDTSNTFFRGLAIDPYGLYIAVGLGTKKSGVDVEGCDGMVDRIELFELTTGVNAFTNDNKKSQSLGNFTPCSSFQFNSTGTQIATVGGGGVTNVRGVPGFIIANLNEFRRKLKVNNNFWSTFPLYVNVTPETTAAMSRAGSPLRGTMSRNTTPNMSRQQSRAGFSMISEMSASELAHDDDGNMHIPRNMQPLDGLAGEMMRDKEMAKDDSKSTLFGRHSSASSPTA
jgi:hypothetical protein